MKIRQLGLAVLCAVFVLCCVAFFIMRGEPSQTPMRTAPAKNTAPLSQVSGKAEEFCFEQNSVPGNQQLGAREKSAREVEALEAAVEPLRGNVVVSFGKVEDIGREAGYVLPSLSEMRSLESVDASKLTPEQRRHLLDLQRRYAGMLGMLPEIAGFQNNPEEYGKFFANMARQSAGLSEAQATQIDGYMRARANEMIQAGLNEANKPADAAQMDAWEMQRDQFNEQTVTGLRQVLSPQVADRAGINEQTMEFFETDFDKAGTQPKLN